MAGFRPMQDLGPPGAPRPGGKAPHQDLGNFLSDIVKDFQGVGEKGMDALDQPFDATIGIEGPHRIVDNYLDEFSETARRVVVDPILRGKYYWPKSR